MSHHQTTNQDGTELEQKLELLERSFAIVVKENAEKAVGEVSFPANQSLCQFYRGIRVRTASRSRGFHDEAAYESIVHFKQQVGLTEGLKTALWYKKRKQLALEDDVPVEDSTRLPAKWEGVKKMKIAADLEDSGRKPRDALFFACTEVENKGQLLQILKLSEYFPVTMRRFTIWWLRNKGAAREPTKDHVEAFLNDADNGLGSFRYVKEVIWKFPFRAVAALSDGTASTSNDARAALKPAPEAAAAAASSTTATAPNSHRRGGKVPFHVPPLPGKSAGTAASSTTTQAAVTVRTPAPAKKRLASQQHTPSPAKRSRPCRFDEKLRDGHQHIQRSLERSASKQRKSRIPTSSTKTPAAATTMTPAITAEQAAIRESLRAARAKRSGQRPAPRAPQEDANAESEAADDVQDGDIPVDDDQAAGNVQEADGDQAAGNVEADDVYDWAPKPDLLPETPAIAAPSAAVAAPVVVAPAAVAPAMVAPAAVAPAFSAAAPMGNDDLVRMLFQLLGKMTSEMERLQNIHEQERKDHNELMEFMKQQAVAQRNDNAAQVEFMKQQASRRDEELARKDTHLGDALKINAAHVAVHAKNATSHATDAKNMNLIAGANAVLAEAVTGKKVRRSIDVSESDPSQLSLDGDSKPAAVESNDEGAGRREFKLKNGKTVVVKKNQRYTIGDKSVYAGLDATVTGFPATKNSVELQIETKAGDTVTKNKNVNSLIFLDSRFE